MSSEENKKLDKILEKIEKIEKWIPSNDVVTNERYCQIRTESGATLKMRGLREWFKKGCPRVDSRHVSITAVNDWALNNNTYKSN